MNELTPNQPAPQPPPVSSQSRGMAMPYATFSTTGSMNANVFNLAAADRAKSFQGAHRGSVNLSTTKYQSHSHQLQQVNDYHAGPYAPPNYSLHKSPHNNRSTGHNGGKFDYADQHYSPQPPPQQQSYIAPFGYPSYTQNYGPSGDYQQHQQHHQHQQQQQQQPTQQHQQYHGGYNQVEANPLGMLVTSATNAQASTDAMPHEPVNIGLKDGGHRKYRQSYNVMPNDSFLSSSGGYVHGVERPGNVVQIKTTPSNTQQSMYQRSNLFGNTAYFSQQQVQQQQRTQESTRQHNSLNLGSSNSSYEANGNESSSMGRSMNSSIGGMFSAGSRIPQFSTNASGPSLTTRLKDGDVDISTGSSSNGSHVSYMQQQSAKSHELTHSTSLYGDVASSTTSMSMEGLSSDGSASTSVNANVLYPPSLAPPSSQLSTSGEDTCGLCSGAHSDRIADHCGHRFHGQCLHSWGGLTTCPICAQVSNTITGLSQNASGTGYGLAGDNITIAQNSIGELPINSGNSLTNTNTGSNSVSISHHSLGPSQMTNINILQVNSGGRPPPIDTRISDTHVGPTSLSGGKRSVTSTRSGSSSSGRIRKNKKLKDCSVPGCDRTVRSRGLCKGHGGGRRCGFTGCGLSDQGGGFCISHGGGKRCQHDGCDNSAQSRGLCKLHGGGSRCTVPNCTKSSQGRGLCRAHGGGRRCMVEGCNKTDRRAGYCVTHGADKKCIIAECSKTGRIDNMCTKHYFERHPAQPPGTVSTTPPPVITVNANTSAARARAERKRAAEQQAVAAHYAGMSSAMLGSIPNTSFDERVGGAMTKTAPF
ncbi:putative Zinc finger, RING-type [Plasmopara halstedii]